MSNSFKLYGAQIEDIICIDNFTRANGLMIVSVLALETQEFVYLVRVMRKGLKAAKRNERSYLLTLHVVDDVTVLSSDGLVLEGGFVNP